MLLAISLSILIMIVWTRFFAPKPPEQQPQQEQATEQIPGQAFEQIPEQAPPPGEPVIPFFDPETVPEPLPEKEFVEARDVVVETSRMSATFTTLGGRLTSLRLIEFDSKRGGGKVELVPQDNDEMQWPLALTFNDPQFGARDDDFVYDFELYGPSDGAVEKLANGLRACSGRFFLESGAGEIRRQLYACLPEDEHDADLRTLVIATAAESAAAQGSADGLTEQADQLAGDSIAVFSRQLTPRLRLIKAFVFPADEYSFSMRTAFQNTSGEPLDLGGGRASYTVTWLPGMESSERHTKYDELRAFSLVEKNFQQKAIKKYTDGTEFPESLTWLGLKRKYFFLVLEPRDGLMGASIKTQNAKQGKVRIGLDMQPMQLAPGGVEADSIRISAGPMLTDVLESLGPGFGQIVNFGFFDLFGKILLAGLLWFNKYVQNYGLAIILLTVVVRVGLFPLNQKSYKSMKEMQALQPLVTELKEKHKNNPQDMNKKMMALYKTHKVNPMGGCLPIAFQMPIFIALFQALRNAVELRGAHFLWIVDLSEPDRLFTLTTPINLPINLLPLLVIVAMLIQQKMTPMAAGGQSETQQKMMQYMPIIFGFLFYSMPSGLTVYFLVSTVLGLVQQYFVQKAA